NIAASRPWLGDPLSSVGGVGASGQGLDAIFYTTAFSGPRVLWDKDLRREYGDFGVRGSKLGLTGWPLTVSKLSDIIQPCSSPPVEPRATLGCCPRVGAL